MAPIATTNDPKLAQAVAGEDARSDASYYSNNHKSGISEGSRTGPVATATKPNSSGLKPCPLRAPLVVTVVGLPCRGKSLASHKVARHLNWRGEYAKVFNVESNATADTLHEISASFKEGNNVAIIDGMHLTRSSRQLLINYCGEQLFHHLLIEFSCNDQCLRENIDDTVQFYHQLDQNIDWERRIKENNERLTPRFEPCSPLEGPMITVNNSEDPMFHSVTARGVRGSIQTSILGVLASPVIRKQTFYFSRIIRNVVYQIRGSVDSDDGLVEFVQNEGFGVHTVRACPEPSVEDQEIGKWNDPYAFLRTPVPDIHLQLQSRVQELHRMWAAEIWEAWKWLIEDFELALSDVKNPRRRVQLLFVSMSEELKGIVCKANLHPDPECDDCYEAFRNNIDGYLRSITAHELKTSARMYDGNDSNFIVQSATRAERFQAEVPSPVVESYALTATDNQCHVPQHRCNRTANEHGESEFNVLGRIGGDADLSPRGMKYGERLARQLGGPGSAPDCPKPKHIWTSELRRTIHTVKNIPGPRAAIKDLNEINAGICEGLTYEEIQERFPQEFAWRDQDKFKYRYPHGESYLDLLQRVDSVVQALLANTDVLVVSHQAVLRCIMAYFKGTKPSEIPYINVPLHTLLIVRSYGYDFKVETVPLKVECVDTYRIQPKNCSTSRTTADALTTVPAHFDTPLSQQQMPTTIS